MGAASASLAKCVAPESVVIAMSPPVVVYVAPAPAALRGGGSITGHGHGVVAFCRGGVANLDRPIVSDDHRSDGQSGRLS